MKDSVCMGKHGSRYWEGRVNESRIHAFDPGYHSVGLSAHYASTAYSDFVGVWHIRFSSGLQESCMVVDRAWRRGMTDEGGQGALLESHVS